VILFRKLWGSVVSDTLGRRLDGKGITIGHPTGILFVGAELGKHSEVKVATVWLTARRLMEGDVFWIK